jgi:hypothetical protein
VLRIQLLWEQVELQELAEHNSPAQIQQYSQLLPVAAALAEVAGTTP